MSAISKLSPALNYLNPLNVLYLPSYILSSVTGAFSALNSLYNSQLPSLEGRALPIAPQEDERKEAPKALDASLVLEHGVLSAQKYPSLDVLLDQSSRPYPIILIELEDGTKIEVAKTFLTDIERIGNPDQFFINEREIKPAPKTDAQKKALLTLLLHIAEGDSNTVKRWTEIWNYRIKVDLVNTMMEEFRGRFKLNPMLAREGGFTEVVISLDTKRQILTCSMHGKISHATDDNTNIVELDVAVRAHFTFDIKKNSVEKQIEFPKSD